VPCQACARVRGGGGDARGGLCAQVSAVAERKERRAALVRAGAASLLVRVAGAGGAAGEQARAVLVALSMCKEARSAMYSADGVGAWLCAALAGHAAERDAAATVARNLSDLGGQDNRPAMLRGGAVDALVGVLQAQPRPALLSSRLRPASRRARTQSRAAPRRVPTAGGGGRVQRERDLEGAGVNAALNALANVQSPPSRSFTNMVL
jgi:hypothetical protein